MKVSQRDIAKAAGVSQPTVSLCFNKKHKAIISDETRAKVLKIAKELNYAGLHSTRYKAKTGRIGYVICSRQKNAIKQSAYLQHLLPSLMGEAEKEHMICTLCTPSNLADLSSEFDGIIVEGSLALKEIAKLSLNIPMVVMRADPRGVDVVDIDNFGGVLKAIEHLADLGHTRIALFGLGPLHSNTEARVNGYLEGIRRYKLVSNPKYIALPQTIDRTLKEVKVFAEEALDLWVGLAEAPTAIVSIGDVYALPALQAATERGIKIPEQMSIIGFDDDCACQYSHPALTSFREPSEEIGRLAVKFLLDRIENPTAPFKRTIVDVAMVERESIGPAP
jgi:LacI family transcriptional regulator